MRRDLRKSHSCTPESKRLLLLELTTFRISRREVAQTLR
jgi:hypothetical protein